MRKTFLAFILALLVLPITCLGQLSMAGEVVEVSDGRTIVVLAGTREIKVELQFIEAPEPGHPLYDTVKGHLRKLLVGKVIEFKPRVIYPDRVIGRVLLNDVDVSRQMLRDGAATHVAKELTGQDKNEFNVYAALEAAARDEKRGVWSPTSITTARVERVETELPRPVLAAVRDQGSSPTPGMFSRPPSLEAWLSGLPANENESAELRGHAGAGYKSVSTPFVILEFTSESGKQTVRCRALYGAALSADEGLFALGFTQSSGEKDLLKNAATITVVAERYVVNLPSLSGGGDVRHYRISKAFLSRIASTRTVEIQIDGYRSVLSDEAKGFLRQLLSASDKPS